MISSRIIVHRANHVQLGRSPVDILTALAREGYKNLEVDMTITGSNEFKFCHPAELNDCKNLTLDTDLFEKLKNIQSDLMWIVDIKYRGEKDSPVNFVQRIYEVFGSNVIFSASIPDLLIGAHDMGAKTA